MQENGMKNSMVNAVVAGFVLLVILLIIIPLPTQLIDVMLIVNISLSVLILLTTIYAKDALDFSAFPTVLLLSTLLRIALNISTTRQILGNNGDAGEVIRTFGQFVIGGDFVVGIIIFLIILVVQFMVITRGSERVSEVAARFTLDAMPGKQMAIDADLNTGLIDEQEAKDRRKNIQRQADFYGAMDGASKFVKGDATAGLIITIINIVGGVIIGLVMGEIPLEDVFSVYILATVGDGLCSQLPALMISTGTGIIVTRAASEMGMGQELSKQMFSTPAVMFVTAIMLGVISLIPGMPVLTVLLIGTAFAAMGMALRRAEQKLAAVPEEEDHAEVAAAEKRRPENVTTLLQVDPIELEFGYGIIPLVDVSQGGDLLDRVVMIRRQCALDMGIIVPVIRLRDNIQLNTNEYVIKIKGVEVARGEVMADHFLALNSGSAMGKIQGIETVEPTFGLPALWISGAEREKAELMGYTTIDPPSVIATHLTEVVKRHSFELLGRQQVQTLIDNIRKTQPALVDEVLPKLFSLGELQRVLANLLREGISIRDMVTILETLGDYGTLTRDTDLLTEYVRQNLRRAITRRFVPDGKAHVITLDPSLEQAIAERVKQTEHGSYVAMEPDRAQRMLLSLKSSIERMTGLGITPVVLTSPGIRKHFKRLTEQLVPDLTVLSYNELEQSVEIYSDGIVNL